MRRVFPYLLLLAIIIFPGTLIASVLVGRTEGIFSVSPSGAATYNIPIIAQKGMSDFIPKISLSYNSQTGNGIAGIGWNISGLSAISIVPRSPYFDGHSEAIYQGEDNAFVLDGMRLMLTSGNNGMTGATYQTENEQYSIIRITNSSNGTPATFQVKATNGTIYHYGSSRGRYTMQNGEIYGWALDYAEDILGNYISYTYSQEGILYPTSITYGRNVHGNSGVDCTIAFNYENRPDSIPSYLFGNLTYFKKRLKSIVCKYSGNTYRTYSLNYAEDTFSRLTSVTESGTSSATLQPTTFEWDIPQFQVTCSSKSMETALLEDLDKEYFFSGDLDGDGITEIISLFLKTEPNVSGYSPHNVFWGRKWNREKQKFEFCYSAQSYSGIEITGMTKVFCSGGIVMHVAHGESNTLVFPYCHTDDIKAFRVAIPDRGWNYNLPLKGMSEGVPPYMIFDADKDGLDEIFVIEIDKYSGRYPAYLVKFNLTTGTSSCTELSLDLQGKPDDVRCADFNNDGMADLMITTSSGYYIYWNRTGKFSDTDRSFGTAFGKCDILEAGDFDGDGLTDLFINKHNSTEWYIARNTGTDTGGYFSLRGVDYLPQAGVRSIYRKEKHFYCIVQDIDGDGKSDAVVGYPHKNEDGGCICILRSDGYTLTVRNIYDFQSSNVFPDRNHIVPGNFDGHGSPQIMYYGKALVGKSVGWHLLDNPSMLASSRKIVSITDGLGSTDSIGYGMLSNKNVYNVNRCHNFPLIRLAGSIPIVTSRTESISSESRTTNYSYANGILHLQGKGFLGFEDIKANHSTGIVTETHSELDSTFYVLLPKTSVQYSANGTVIKRDTYSTYLRGIGSRSYTTGNTNHVSRNPLSGFDEGEAHENFKYGFPTYQESSDDLINTTTETTLWESSNDSVWLKGLPQKIETTKTEHCFTNDEAFEEIVYERDSSTGLILKELRKRNGLIVSTEEYSYNEYGQMTSHCTIPYNSTDTLVTQYFYNSKGQLWREREPKGLLKTYTYHPQHGMLLRLLDFDGVQTQYTYDGFLRETSRRTPIITYQTTRSSSNYGGSVYAIRESATGEATVFTYYDAWNRKVAESSYLADGTLMFKDTHYLPNGRVGFVSFPHKRTETTSEGTTYTYDNTHRIISSVDTNGKTSTWSYLPTRVVNCTDGITTTTDYYTQDKVHVVEDASGWIEYMYNADRNISTIYSDNSEANYSYDTYGRLVQTTDMNGVTKEYSYDSNGYPYRTTIAGSVLETNYDKYGILRSKSWADIGGSPHTVNYTYDHRLRLTKEEGEGYSNNYSYDSYGRMTGKLCKVEDEQPEGIYITKSYGTGNQVSQTIYDFNTLSWESSIGEQYSYSLGHKISDVLKDTLVWSLKKQDRWGNTTEVRDTLGTTTYSYDDYGNMLAMSRPGIIPINGSYTYDVQTGNMSSKDNVPLSYDSMNQLTGWGNYNYSYDNQGNITHQPFVGDFSYNGYKVTGLSTDNGYLPDDSLRISYYKSIERPRSIENNLYKADLYYDGNGDRFMMKVFKKEDGDYHLLFTRYYLDAKAEITKDSLGDCTYLYYAGEDAYTAPAVMVIDENENSSIFQISRDNMGSAIKYENIDGNYYQNSYSPWGVRTYPGESTIFYKPGESPIFGPFYRTYTGHEDLWMFGLLNANARLYSPYLGRFISPDPLLNEEGGPLNYNPYIYARNNPYRYIDRDGEFPFLLLGAVVFGGITNVMYNKDNIHNFLQGLGYFGVGAAASAACIAVSYIPLCSVGGFLGGAILGGAGGGLSGFILGGGNALLSGGSFWDSALTGLWQGAASGVVVGGLSGGASASKHNKKFWTGKSRQTLNKASLDAIYPSESLQETPNNLDNTFKQVNPNDVVTQSLENQQMLIGQGNSSVYVGYDETSTIRYVGRTDRMPEIRFGEHYRLGSAVSKLEFQTIQNKLSHQSSRIIEQQLINTYGLEKNGGQLYNKINSITPKNWNKWGIW